MYDHITQAAQHMDCSGGMSFSSNDPANVQRAIAVATTHYGASLMAQVDAEIGAFAAQHHFGYQWAGQGQDDEGNEPPISAEANAVLEAIYNAA